MKRILLVSLILLTLAAAGAGWWFLRPTHVTWLTDADTIRESAASATLREVLWQRPAPLVDLIQAQADEFEPRVSADGGTLFFVRGKPGRNADIFVCTRERAGWGRPAALVEINTDHDELGPDPSADGHSLYFYSDRPGGLGGYDLWVARRTEQGWQPPTNLGNAVNSVYNEYGPALSPDSRTLCFSSNRPKPGEATPSDDAWRATVREDLYRHDYDLYAASITDAGYQPAAPLVTLNSAQNDGAPAYSPIGDFLYFSSDRPTGHGGFDLYRSRLLREQFQPPANLGAAVNTAANELDPALDVGGYALHFSSDRSLSDAAKPAANTSTPPACYRLYRTFSREVFHDVEVRQPTINWAALWKQIGPNLMWALLALIVFILLLALMRDLHRRRLSLLARCLIVSLMIHMLLMLWFNAVEVTASIATAIRRSGPIQVGLSSAARVGDLSLQVRGGLTQADAPPATAPPLDRAAPTMSPTVSPKPVEMPVEQIAAAPRASSLIQVRTVDASPRHVSAPPRHAVTADFSGIAANYALPAEQSRSDASERPEAAPDSVQAMKIGRYSSPVATTQPAAPSQLVELAVDTIGAGRTPSQSLVVSGPPSDASPNALMPSLVQTTLTAAVLGATHTIEPALPIADAGPRSTVGEAASIPAADLSAPPRAGNAVVSTSGAHPVAMQQLAPESGAPTGSPTSLVTGTIGSRDSQPAFGAPLPGGSGGTIGFASTPSPGGMGGEIDIALPIGEPGERVSNAESGGGSGGSVGSGAILPLPRAAPNIGGIGNGVGTGTGTANVALAPAASSHPHAGGQSLVGGNALTGGRAEGTNGTGLSGARVPAPSAPNMPFAALPTTADPANVAIDLPTETTPPPAEVAAAPTVAVGRIRGRVSDYATGQRLAGARVQLDLPDSGTLVAMTDAGGTYELAVPELPDFFAVSASKTGYLPKTRNVANRSVVGRSMRLNFTLRPQSLQVISLEEVPIVHHLGNDAFEGQINSQFQREAEGRAYTASFELSPGQRKADQAELKLLVKGIQCPHKIKINGQLLEARLDHSPEDGSFGSFSMIFDAELLAEGTNTVEVRGVSCNGDLDDFEFVNLQVVLFPNAH